MLERHKSNSRKKFVMIMTAHRMGSKWVNYSCVYHSFLFHKYIQLWLKENDFFSDSNRMANIIVLPKIVLNRIIIYDFAIFLISEIFIKFIENIVKHNYAISIILVREKYLAFVLNGMGNQTYFWSSCQGKLATYM